jgi:hypothetical protein
MRFKTFYSTKESLLLCFEDIEKQLKEEFREVDFLLIGFHPKYNYKDFSEKVKKVFPNVKYVGFHALNLFSDINIVEGVVIGAFKFEREGRINIYSCDSLTDDKLIEAKEYLNSRQNDTHFIIASLAEEDFSFFIEELSSNLDYSPVNNIIGGISSGIKVNGEIRTYQFIDDKILKNGFVIISFENVISQIDISLGFEPYGVTYEITKCDGNIIYIVDQEKNFAEILRRLLEGIEDPKEEYLWHLPINIIDDDGYVSTLRTVEKLEKDYVKLYGPVKRYQKFKLSFATKYDLIKEDEKISQRLANKMVDIEASFNFSCVARQYILDDKQTEEPEIYVKNFDSHLFGFFTFGEIGPDKKYKKLKLYNETSLICVMKEL